MLGYIISSITVRLRIITSIYILVNVFKVVIVIGDCTLYEKKVICEIILSLKESIRQNKSLIIHEVK